MNNCTWSVPECKGNLPLARSSHAAVSLGHFMVVHGGEAVVPAKKKSNPNPSISRVPSVHEPSIGIPSNNASVNLTKSSVLNVPSEEKTIDASKGVCPGDSLQSTKLGPAVRVSLMIMFALR